MNEQYFDKRISGLSECLMLIQSIGSTNDHNFKNIRMGNSNFIRQNFHSNYLDIFEIHTRHPKT